MGPTLHSEQSTEARFCHQPSGPPSVQSLDSPVHSKSRCRTGHGPRLSPFLRLYIYGIHGYFTEVMFTAAWEFVVNTNWKFPGCTSVWSLIIYALSGFAIEQMYLRFDGRMHIAVRGIIYLLWTYSWEFGTGYTLRYFNACPWDYSLFDFNVLGLITFEYAPLWYIATLLQEQLLTKYILRLQWNPCSQTCECRRENGSGDHSFQGKLESKSF